MPLQALAEAIRKHAASGTEADRSHAVESLLPCLRGMLTRLTAYKCAAEDGVEVAAAIEECLRV